MAQKGCDTLLADALDTLQARQKEVLATTVAVVGNSETVRLIANMADDLQRFACATQIVRHRVVGIEYLLQALCQAYDRHPVGNAQLLQHGIGTRKLTLATIYNNQIGQFSPLLQESGVATGENLTHRGKIIGTDNGLDIEVAVLLA